ncbi:AsmA family protein [Pseudochelatococcus contaminans]|uniref:AsmA protein n=1 Tax=Pseudochelatococcus contaminans TaxID=1538103 RepID=A0A7W5Z3X3_9HYPH|nr:AsmA-like C-terminal region-containing protein [Pseudochelatococcus contaminans]MBB3809519.1 AsmA protein [Pseudochelatococcus contaminans]
MTLRRRYLFLLFAGIAVVAAGSIPWPAGSLSVHAEIERQMKQLLGYEVSGEDSFITFLPVPRIDFVEVAVGPDAAIGRADEVSVMLSPWSLLLGRIKVGQVVLTRPRMTWNGPVRVQELWSEAYRRTMALATTADGSAPRLPGRMMIVDGTITVPGKSRSRVQKIDATVKWPSAGRQLDITATALWRGELVDLRVDKLHPAALAAGLPSQLVLRVSAQPMSLSFAGRINPEPLPTFDGLVNFRTGSLSRAASWLDTPLTFARSAGPVSIKSSASLKSGALSMPDVRIEAAGGTLEGAMAARYNDSGRILISATLDSAALDLNRVLTPLSHSMERSAGFSAMHREKSGEPAPNDVDVRLSISRATVGPLEMQDVAAAILVSSDRTEFALNQAQLGRGTVRGRLQVAPGNGHTETRLNGVFEGIDAQKTVQQLFGLTLLSGPATGNIALTANGTTWHQLTASLDGNVSARIDKGNLIGVDLVDVIDRAARSPLATALDWQGGRTPFDTAQALLVVTRGYGQLEGAMAASGIAGRIGGGISFVDRTLDMRASIRRVAADSQPGDANAAADAIGFPIEITGSWDYPIVTPDIRALIDRSDAIAPLRLDENRHQTPAATSSP